MREDFRKWFLRGTATLVILCPLAWLILEARGLYVTSANHSEQAAALSALAAVGGLVTTMLLLAVTGWYAVLTRGILQKSGPIVSTDLLMGWADPAGQGVLTCPFDLSASTPDARFTVPKLVVRVRNAGNGATTVDSIGVQHDPPFEYSMTSHRVGPQVPYRLEGNTVVNFFLEMPEFIAGVKVIGKNGPGKARAKAYMGGGDVVCSKWHQVGVQ